MKITRPKTKNEFIKHLPYIIRNNLRDHDLYFVTFSFNDLHKEVPPDAYREYFKSFIQKINQLSVNRPSDNFHLKAKMIAIPEESHEKAAEHMHKATHYHAVLFIHENNFFRFHKKCIVDRRYVYDKKKEQHRLKFILEDKLIKQSRAHINIHSIDMQPVSSRADIINIASYMTKNFKKRDSEFDYEDVEFFSHIT